MRSPEIIRFEIRRTKMEICMILQDIFEHYMISATTLPAEKQPHKTDEVLFRINDTIENERSNACSVSATTFDKEGKPTNIAIFMGNYRFFPVYSRQEATPDYELKMKHNCAVAKAIQSLSSNKHIIKDIEYKLTDLFAKLNKLCREYFDSNPSDY